MGNKVSQLTQFISEGKLVLDSERGDETLERLDVIIEYADMFISGEEKLGMKERRSLSSLVSHLSNEVGKEYRRSTSPAVLRACRIKACTALLRLLCVPQQAKRDLEGAIVGICKCINLASGANSSSNNTNNGNNGGGGAGEANANAGLLLLPDDALHSMALAALISAIDSETDKDDLSFSVSMCVLLESNGTYAQVCSYIYINHTHTTHRYKYTSASRYI